jgi:hypothetical protein
MVVAWQFLRGSELPVVAVLSIAASTTGGMDDHAIVYGRNQGARIAA